MALQTQRELHIIESGFAAPVMGPQRQALSAAAHSGMAPIEALSSGVVRMASGHNADAHIHAESAITVCVRTGMVASLVGEEMTPLVHAPGSVIYIGPGIPHIGVNLYPHTDNPATPDEFEAELFEVRTDPTFYTDVKRRPDLDALVAERVAQLRRDFALGLFAEKLAQPSVHVVWW